MRHLLIGKRREAMNEPLKLTVIAGKCSLAECLQSTIQNAERINLHPLPPGMTCSRQSLSTANPAANLLPRLLLGYPGWYLQGQQAALGFRWIVVLDDDMPEAFAQFRRVRRVVGGWALIDAPEHPSRTVCRGEPECAHAIRPTPPGQQYGSVRAVELLCRYSLFEQGRAYLSPYLGPQRMTQRGRESHDLERAVAELRGDADDPLGVVEARGEFESVDDRHLNAAEIYVLVFAHNRDLGGRSVT